MVLELSRSRAEDVGETNDETATELRSMVDGLSAEIIASDERRVVTG